MNFSNGMREININKYWVNYKLNWQSTCSKWTVKGNYKNDVGYTYICTLIYFVQFSILTNIYVCLDIRSLKGVYIKTLYSHLPPEDIMNCENGIFKEDTKLKCYMFCILEEASIVSYPRFVCSSLHRCRFTKLDINRHLIYY